MYCFKQIFPFLRQSLSADGHVLEQKMTQSMPAVTFCRGIPVAPISLVVAGTGELFEEESAL